MWAAMAAGDFGDEFTRQALALVGAIDTSE
jgi:hypothetical protein